MATGRVDTIAAVATATGKGGVGVVRVSGPAAWAIAQAICSKPPAVKAIQYCNFVDEKRVAIDSGIALFFRAPHSFTGEDVLELQGHGGPIIVQMLLQRVLELNGMLDDSNSGHLIRMAGPGEFTQRAFLNDKLDLAQAEAVADLIDAQTEQAARLANRSLQGVFSKQIHELLEQMIRLRMLVEATLDFPEEEIDFLKASDAQGQLRSIDHSLTTILSKAKQGALLRNGLNIVLAGAPNVGKSSLLNALAGTDVAIVTPIAGTTRDKVVQAINVQGIALNIIDTAGLRSTDDTVEKMGIERTWSEVERADVVLHLQAVDIADDPVLLEKIQARLRAVNVRHTPVLSIINKVDLAVNSQARIEGNQVFLSASKFEGLEFLRAKLLEIVGWQSGGDDMILARERQLIALRAAHAHVQVAQQHAALGNAQLDVMAEELRLAQSQLSEITGEFTADDLLGEIFSRFCIGK